MPSHLAIVLDDSESMRFSDPYTDDSRAVALAADMKLASAGGKTPVERLRETPRLGLVQEVLRPGWIRSPKGRKLYVYDLDSAAKEGTANAAQARKLDDVQPKRPISPLGDAIRGVLASHRGQPVAGIVLATDGRSNTGEDPLRAAEAAIRQNIPIYVVAAGADEGPRNIRLAEIEVSPVVFVRDPMTLGVVVEARGLKDAEATVVLEQRINEGGWEPIGSQRVVLGEDGILKRTTFRITPKAVGQYEYRARVEDAGPELTQDDNVATAAVRVVRQQIRVLLIAGAPSPEVQFLRNALQRDQHVDFAAWMQHADPGFRQPGDHPITRLPNDAAELRRYDAVLLVDPDMRALGPQWPEMLTNFVGQEGGGLIFVAGELHSQQLFESADARSPGGEWTRHPAGRPRAGAVPHRGRGAAQQPEHVHAGTDARGPRRPGLRVPRRPDPQPVDPDQPAGDVLELPGDASPPRRGGAGPTRRPADAEPVRPAGAAGLAALRAGPDGLHRLRQHLSLAVPVGGLLRRLLGAAGRPRGPQQGAGGPVPVPGEPGQERLPRRRPGGDLDPIHRPGRDGRGVGAGRRAGDRRPAARARSGSSACPTTPGC